VVLGFIAAHVFAQDEPPTTRSAQDPQSQDATTRPATGSDDPRGGVIEGPEGLRYVITQAAPETVGEQMTVAEGDVVMIHYTGRLADGTVFDTSRQVRARSALGIPEPIVFRVGDGRLIRGWELGVQGMKMHERRRLVIPPELGYGERGTPGGPIPPNATLTFDVQVVGIAKPEMGRPEVD
jgi:FKBP-type peptidyl-prolyl cis-trans isomerase